MIMDLLEIGAAIIGKAAEMEAREEKEKREKEFKSSSVVQCKKLGLNQSNKMPVLDEQEFKEARFGRDIIVNYEQGYIKYWSEYGYEEEIVGSDVWELEKVRVTFPVGKMDILSFKTGKTNIYIYENNPICTQIFSQIIQKNESMLWAVYDVIINGTSYMQEVMAYYVRRALSLNYVSEHTYCDEIAQIIGKKTDEGKKAIANCSGNSAYTYVPYSMTFGKVCNDISHQIQYWLSHANRTSLFFEVNGGELEKLSYSLPWITPEHRHEYMIEQSERYARVIKQVMVRTCGGDLAQYEYGLQSYKGSLDDHITNVMQTEMSEYEKICEILLFLKEQVGGNRKMISVVSNSSTIQEHKQALIFLLNAESELLVNEMVVRSNSLIVDYYGDIEKNKKELVRFLDSTHYTEAIVMYKKIQKSYSELLSLKKIIDDCGIHKDFVSNHLEFHYNASIVVSKRINDLQRNKERCRYINEDEYKRAAMYIHGVDSYEEVLKIEKRKSYIENKKKGIAAEQEVNHILDFLPKEYIKISAESEDFGGEKCIILQNRECVSHDQQFDHLVVGPQGVFAIETKNYSGKIVIDENRNWNRMKEGVLQYDQYPMKQIEEHEFMLESILGEDVPIINILCLANPRVIVEGEENFPVKIIKSDRLREYIKNFKVDKLLSSKEISEIVARIKAHMKRQE